jgi:hypothetical protein
VPAALQEFLEHHGEYGRNGRIASAIADAKPQGSCFDSRFGASPLASFIQSSASRSQASLSLGFVVCSAFRRHSSASRRNLSPSMSGIVPDIKGPQRSRAAVTFNAVPLVRNGNTRSPRLFPGMPKVGPACSMIRSRCPAAARRSAPSDAGAMWQPCPSRYSTRPNGSRRYLKGISLKAGISSLSRQPKPNKSPTGSSGDLEVCTSGMTNAGSKPRALVVTAGLAVEVPHVDFLPTSWSKNRHVIRPHRTSSFSTQHRFRAS